MTREFRFPFELAFLLFCGMTQALGLEHVARAGALAETGEEQQSFVEQGVPNMTLLTTVGGTVAPANGYLEVEGLDTHVVTTVGLGEGDFHVRARLAIHGLERSAAAFKINYVNSFGFEGGHGKMYVTGPLFDDAHGKPIADPVEYIQDGEPFRFEVIRRGERLEVRIDDKLAYEQDVPTGPLGPLGLTGRRAALHVLDFSAKAHFVPADVCHVSPNGIRLHEKVTWLSNLMLGPFVRVDDGILTIEGRSTYISDDGGESWRERSSFDAEEQLAFSPERALIRTTDGTLVCVFMNQTLRTWGWDAAKDVPVPAAQSDVWAIRSRDDGRSWIDRQVLYDDSYCGCIRGLVQVSQAGSAETSSQTKGVGNVIASVQGFVPELHRHATFPYVSTDTGKSWQRTDTILDLPGRGHHDGIIEGTALQLRDGRVWLLLRSAYDQLYSSYSSDGGLTWTKVEPSGIDASDGPAILSRLADGRIVLLWNRLYPEGETSFERRGGNDRTERMVSGHREELSLSLSSDEGRTWTRPVVVGRKKNARVAYPYVFEPRPGYLWVTTMQGGLRIGFELSELVAPDAETRPMSEWPW